MPEEILSVAIYEPLPGMEAVSLATMRELMAILAMRGYSRDFLYRDGDQHYVLLRYWKSEASRRAAQEDPDVLRCWARLGNEIQTVKVYETLREVSLDKGA
jgi:heme-degrading monooxygenase HmoA